MYQTGKGIFSQNDIQHILSVDISYLQVKVICPAHPCQARGPLWAGEGEGKRHSGANPPPVASPLEKGPQPHWNITIKTIRYCISITSQRCLHKHMLLEHYIIFIK